jgi:hypothetical protein
MRQREGNNQGGLELKAAAHVFSMTSAPHAFTNDRAFSDQVESYPEEQK